MNTIDPPGIPRIVIFGKPEVVRIFGGLLQGGVRVPCRTEVDLESLLTDDFGIDPAYLESISTIFLNGSCVDDLGGAIARDGDTLALSSGLPGLVGASLRRGGPLAALRSGITLTPSSAEGLPSRGMITVKLFNLVMKELGPAFLRRGVIVDREDLKRILDASDRALREWCDHADLDGRTVPATMLSADLVGDGHRSVLLKVLVPEC